VSDPALLPILTLISSAIPGVLIFALGDQRGRARVVLNLLGAVVKLVLIAVMLLGVARGHEYEARYPLLAGLDFVLHADALALLFVTLSAGLWLLTTIYAIGYFADKPHQARFFGFFSLCVSATTGIALAGNLLTFLIFYELLTLSTYPLVVHWGDRESLRVGRRYLAYTLAGGALLFVAIVWAHGIAGPFDFDTERALAGGDPIALRGLFVLFIVALGVKTAIVPLHGWLPKAMVAPAPVSALLHAVAVVKAGAFGIIRVVYGVFGPKLSRELGVLEPLTVVASVTIIYGSLRALVQDDLKRRLAYSTISQVSYIVLGVAVFGPFATIGGLAHLVHQGVMKITLFFCAGIFAERLDVHRVSEMRGLGRRMPWTMLAFTIAALGMIGLPPIAGFVSKWYLGLGAVEAGHEWVLAVLVASTALNAMYFLPIIHTAWFCERDEPWPQEPEDRREASAWLLVPPVITAALSVLLGLFAASDVSALAWTVEIVERRYFE
jgi:multicomponent Na+:H+ antiporter subunit D